MWTSGGDRTCHQCRMLCQYHDIAQSFVNLVILYVLLYLSVARVVRRPLAGLGPTVRVAVRAARIAAATTLAACVSGVVVGGDASLAARVLTAVRVTVVGVDGNVIVTVTGDCNVGGTG